MSRAIRVAAALAALPLTAAGPPSPDNLADLAGGWELSRDGSNRTCVLRFALEPVTGGHVLRFPAGCRRAMPILAAAGAWAIPERDVVRLLAVDGRLLLEFRSEADGSLKAKAAAGESYRLERRDPDKPAVDNPPLPPPPTAIPLAAAVDPANAPPAATVAGTYAVDRDTERDICRLSLAATAPDAHGRSELRILEGCGDIGLKSFEPVAWRYEGGRLLLTSRRGYEAMLVPEGEGRWRRHPEVGATLVLRKTPAP